MSTPASTPDSSEQNFSETPDSSPLSEETTEPTPPPKPQYPDRYECRSCGYIYEPTEGDSRAQIAPNTLFEDVPDPWKCPVCRAPKAQFINIGPKGAPSGFEENLRYGLGVNAMTPAQKRLLIFGGLVLAFLFMMSFYGVK
jgi:rubredoxin